MLKLDRGAFILILKRKSSCNLKKVLNKESQPFPFYFVG